MCVCVCVCVCVDSSNANTILPNYIHYISSLEWLVHSEDIVQTLLNMCLSHVHFYPQPTTNDSKIGD